MYDSRKTCEHISIHIDVDENDILETRGEICVVFFVSKRYTNTRWRLFKWIRVVVSPHFDFAFLFCSRYIWLARNRGVISYVLRPPQSVQKIFAGIHLSWAQHIDKNKNKSGKRGIYMECTVHSAHSRKRWIDSLMFNRWKWTLGPEWQQIYGRYGSQNPLCGRWPMRDASQFDFQ